MLEHILSALTSFIIAVMQAAGYPGVTLLMAIEAACIPLPSEVIMPFAGFLVAQGRFTLIGAATAAAIGENIGAAIAYEAGKRGGRPLVARWGHLLLIDAHHLDQADRFFARFGGPAALIGRLLPVIRTFIAFPAGVARMNRATFHLYTTLGSWPWCFALAWVGMKLGDRWNSDPRVKAWFHRLDAVIVALVVVALVLFVWHRLRSIRRSREHRP
ncbi:DedA family protein [Sphingomonas sp.]|uniref:DedA family protein n=1 Tax=Sphingomonas sp. TaxID=28214 RepID=UPI003CC648E8